MLSVTAQNSDIAEIFDRFADLLEVEKAHFFKIRAYRNASRLLRGLPRGVAEMLEEGEDLTQLPGIGKALASKIEQIVHTGKLSQLEELERRIHQD